MTDETVNKNKKKKKPDVVETELSETNAVMEETAAVDDVAEEKPLVPKKIDPNQIVTVRNGFQGTLVYKSKHTNEKWVWDEFGAEQDMELSELKSARSSNKKFFINNWFMFDEDWIVDYLGVRRYYENALPLDDFDKLFEKPASEVENVISKLSDGQKKSVAYRAKQLIAEGGIDSNKTISTLEQCLGIELIER